MSEKQCTKCGEVKPFADYYKMASGKHGLQAECKACVSIRRFNSREPKRKELSEKAKIYRKENAESIKQSRKKRYEKNRAVVLERNKKYQKANKAIRNKQQALRRSTDTAFRLTCNIRKRVRKVLLGINKSAPTQELLGCTYEQARQHLQNQFTEGMSWDNYGLYGWHVDHIIPCASFDMSDPEEQRKCFHYTNLQPLWAKDNLRKSDKLNYNQ